MKKQFFAVMSFTACLVGCNQSLEISPEIQEAGVYATIQQPESPVSVKSLNWGDSKLAFTWSEGENVVVFGDGDAAMFRTVTAGAAESKLESKGFKLQDGVSYYACIPAYTMGFNASVSAVPVSFTGQRQLANNNSDHLKYYDYACASATKAEGTNALSFELKNQVSWIVLEHNFASAVENVVSFSISCADADCFAASGSLDVANSTFTAQKMASEIKLALGEEGGTGLSFQAGETFRGFITVAPVDLTGKTLAIKANLADGTVLDLGTIAAGGTIVANKPQVIMTSGTKAAVASVGGVEYATVQAAMAAVKDGETMTLVSDVKSGEGLFLAAGNKNFTIDLSGHTLESTANAGSTGTKNQVMHFEKGNTIVIKNGTIAAEAGNKTTKFIIQNYANLTLEDVTIDAANLNYPGQVCYAMSNNCGNVLLKGNTSIINVPKGAVALDACKYASYEKPTVTLSTTGTIGGTIELTGGDLVLGADLNVTESIVGREGAASTISLNKYKIYAPNTAVYNENGTLNITGSGTGGIVSEKHVGVMVGNNTKTTLTKCKVTGLEGAVATGKATGASIIINEGTYTATDNAVIAGNGSVRDGEPNTIELTKAILTGSIKSPGYIACGVYAPWKDNIILNAVAINVTNGVGVLVRGGKVVIKDTLNKYPRKITVTGTTSGWVGDNKNLIECKTLVVDKAAKYSDWENATIEVEAGDYSDDCAKEFLIAEKGLAERNGRYVVVNETIPTTAEEFETAFNKAGVITTVNKNLEVGCVSAGKNHILNLSDDAVISGSGQASGTVREVILTSNSLDIKGQGKIVSTISNDMKNSQSTALRVGGGTVNIYDGVELDGGNGCDGNYAIKIVKGTVNIYGGYFHSAPKTEGDTTEVIYLQSGWRSECHLNIYGGVFESGGDPEYLINCYDKYRSACHIEITGGTFVGFNPADNTADGEHTNYVADGYVSTQTTYNGKTAWEVSKK